MPHTQDVSAKQTSGAQAAARAAEPRWPGAVAVIAVGMLDMLIPSSLSAGPGWVGVSLVAALAVAALVFERWHVMLGHAATGVATGELALSLYDLVRDLTHHRGEPSDLLQAALVLWSMNVCVFSAWYWRLDAGGPHHRSRHDVYCGGAFLFPQLTLPAPAKQSVQPEGWRPDFVDYLFLAFNTSTAFSPTDVPVLSRWAKVLMMLQSSISLATLAMVAARAVNIL